MHLSPAAVDGAIRLLDRRRAPDNGGEILETEKVKEDQLMAIPTARPNQ